MHSEQEWSVWSEQYDVSGVWCWCRGQQPGGSTRDICEGKELKCTVLIVPDRSHTGAVTTVTSC